MVIDVQCLAIENDISHSFEQEEDMPPPPEKHIVASLALRMASAEQALGIRKKKSLQWIRDHWKDVAIVASLGIAIWAVIHPDWKSTDNELLKGKNDSEIDTKLAEHHFDQMVTDVTDIKGQLKVMVPYLAAIAQGQANKTATLSLPEFEHALPELKTTLQIAKLTNADVPSAVVQQIQSKLSKSSRDQPEFWEAASSLVNYQYPPAPQVLPDCYEGGAQRITTGKFYVHPHQGGVSTIGYYNNCKLDPTLQLWEPT